MSAWAHLRRLLAACVLAAPLLACSHTEPWQREALADPRLRWTPCPERATAREHVLAVREGTQGGHGDHGSGCGCD